MNSELKPTISQINRSFRKFSDFTQDLLNSDMNTFEDRVHRLVSYCKTDQVFSIIHLQLVGGDDAEYENWLAERKETVKGMVGSGDLIFPINEDTRIATMYWLLRKIDSNEMDAVNFAHDFYATSSNKVSQYIRFFTDTVVAPLKRDLEYRFEEMMEGLPSNPTTTVPVTSIQIIHSAKNVIQQNAHGSDINQSAKIQTKNEVPQLFESLRAEVRRIVQDEIELNEAIDTINDAEELAMLDPPKKSAVQRLLSLLPTLGNIGSIASAIVGAIAL